MSSIYTVGYYCIMTRSENNKEYLIRVFKSYEGQSTKSKGHRTVNKNKDNIKGKQPKQEIWFKPDRPTDEN